MNDYLGMAARIAVVLIIAIYLESFALWAPSRAVSYWSDGPNATEKVAYELGDTTTDRVLGVLYAPIFYCQGAEVREPMPICRCTISASNASGGL